LTRKQYKDLTECIKLWFILTWREADEWVPPLEEEPISVPEPLELLGHEASACGSQHGSRQPPLRDDGRP